MEPKPDSRPEEWASQELESAHRALSAALFWWNQALAAERATEWKLVTLRQPVPPRS